MISSPPMAAIFGMTGLTLTDAERVFFKRTRPLGYILFARNIESPAQVIALVNDLRGIDSSYAPLVLIDQEGGRVQRLKPPYWRHAPTMAEFGALNARNPARAAEVLRLNMRLIGEELVALGIDVDCAPVMDVPVPGAHDVIGDRAFNGDPAVVAAMSPHVCEGLIDAGVVPVIKHIPGHGRAVSDSHKELPVVSADLATLRAHDFAPFKALCAMRAVNARDSNEGGPPPPGLQDSCFAMTAHVVYRAIDAAKPATTSKTVIHDIIRGEIGFRGLLMSDDLGMKALTGPFEDRAAAALEAGCDVVLHCEGVMAEMEAVAKGAGPLGANGLRALEATAPIRRKPRTPAGHVAVASFQVLDALRHG
jgi:beta-N-acetylhexosaminidase